MLIDQYQANFLITCFNIRMKILPIYVFNKQNFTGIIGYDDSVSQERRKYIRQHYENEIMPYQSIYEKEPRLDEYKLKQLIDFFAAKPKNIDGETIYSCKLKENQEIKQMIEKLYYFLKYLIYLLLPLLLYYQLIFLN